MDFINIMKNEKLENCWNTIGIWGNGSCNKLNETADCRNCEDYSIIARTLLDRPIPEEFINEWTGTTANKKEIEDFNRLSLLMFRVKSEWLAMKTSFFKEMTDVTDIHSIPMKTNNIFKGLTNINGELLLVFSLSDLFSLGDDNIDENKNISKKIIKRMVVIVNSKNERFAFISDEIFGVIHIIPEIINDTPSTISKAPMAYTTGIFKHNNFHVGLLDDEKLFSAFSRSLTI